MKVNHARVFTSPASNEHFEILHKTELSPSITGKSRQLHDAILKSKELEPIYVNDYAPSDHRRRHEFIYNLKVPSKSILFTYSGSGPSHLHFIWKISEFDDSTQILNEASKIAKELSKDFPTYHSRAMRMEFVQSFSQATG